MDAEARQAVSPLTEEERRIHDDLAALGDKYRAALAELQPLREKVETLERELYWYRRGNQER